LSRWAGSGDYSLSRNSIALSPGNIPMMHKDKQSVVVRHREFIATITRASSFTVQQSFILNPGLKATFPWLSGIAQNFQEYEFLGIVFHYVPTSGAVTTSQGLGSVMLQTSYRSNDALPQSKIEMLNEYCANEAVPSEAFCHPVECDPKENPFQVHYVRAGNIPSGDQLLYDLGVTHLAVQGMPGTDSTAVGDLWVTYEVVLKKPVVSSNVSTLAGFFEQVTTGGTLTSVMTSVVSYTAGTLPVTGLANTITLPRGTSGLFHIFIKIESDLSGLTAAGAFTWSGNPAYVNCVGSPIDGPTDFRVDTLGTTCTSINQVYYACGARKDNPSDVATVIIPPVTGFTGVISNATVWVYNFD
jgi:hypothetical protein